MERPDCPPEVQSLMDTSEEELSALEVDIKVKLFILLQNTNKKILNKLLGEISEWVSLSLDTYSCSIRSLKLSLFPLICSSLWCCMAETKGTMTFDPFVCFSFNFRRVKLDPTALKKEVELLKHCSTEGLLKSLRYTSGKNYLHISLLTGTVAFPYENSAAAAEMEVIISVRIEFTDSFV